MPIPYPSERGGYDPVFLAVAQRGIRSVATPTPYLHPNQIKEAMEIANRADVRRKVAVFNGTILGIALEDGTVVEIPDPSSQVHT